MAGGPRYVASAWTAQKTPLVKQPLPSNGSTGLALSHNISTFSRHVKTQKGKVSRATVRKCNRTSAIVNCENDLMFKFECLLSNNLDNSEYC
jgi:hypothetical protein